MIRLEIIAPDKDKNRKFDLGTNQKETRGLLGDFCGNGCKYGRLDPHFLSRRGERD